MNTINDIHQIRGVDGLIGYFASKLGWNIDLESFDSIDNISYELGASDLGVEEGKLAKINSLRQLRPFDANQKWGMFCLELDNWKFSISALRHVLNGLVSSKRNNPTARAWNLKDLLFLCEWGDAENRWVGVAHFEVNEKGYPLVKTINCAMTGRMVSEDAIRIFEDRLSRFAWPKDTVDVNAWSRAWSDAFEMDYVNPVLEILESHPYISWETLSKKMLGIPGHSKRLKEELRRQIDDESVRADSMIGIVSATEAAKAVINEGVVYSQEWSKSRSDELGTTGPAETIGLDLYVRMRENGWWCGPNMPDWNAMERADSNHIIAEVWCFNVRDTLGRKFLERWHKHWEEYQSRLVQQRKIAEAEHYEEKSVFQGYESYMKGKELMSRMGGLFLFGTRRIQSDLLKQAIDYFLRSEREGCPLAKYQLGKMCRQNNRERSDAYFRGATPGLIQMANAGSEEAADCLSRIQKMMSSQF